MADSDLQLRGGGYIQTRIEGGAGLKRIFFRRFGLQFGPKIRKGRVPRGPSLDPPLAPCKVIKVTLGFWIPRSEVDSGFQVYWIPNYLSVELGFRIFIVTVTDSWFPSEAEKRIQSPWFRDCTSRNDRIPFFPKITFLVLFFIILLFCVLASPSFLSFFWKRELMPDN